MSTSKKMPARSRQDAAKLAVARDKTALAWMAERGLPFTARSFAEAYNIILDEEDRGSVGSGMRIKPPAVASGAFQCPRRVLWRGKVPVWSSNRN